MNSQANNFTKHLFFILILSVILSILFFISLAFGSKSLNTSEIINSVFSNTDSKSYEIIWQYRMPRTLLAIIVGIALGVAGVLMQSLTQNPLADAGLLGINSGAAFFAVIAMSVFGLVNISQYFIFALFGAAFAFLFVHLLSGRAPPSVKKVRLLLSGTALSACLASATGIITLFDVQTFDAWRFWIIGSFDGRGWTVIYVCTPIIMLGLILSIINSRGLDALSLGEEMGQALGQNIARTKIIGFICLILLCGSATAAAGPLGFVGLIIPHAIKLITGPNWRLILIYSIFASPILVLAADILGRIIARPDEIEAGIVLAFIGSPILIALVYRGGHSGVRSGLHKSKWRGYGIRKLKSLYFSRNH